MMLEGTASRTGGDGPGLDLDPVVALREYGKGVAWPVASVHRIGRGPDCEVRLADPRVSTLHATITSKDGRLLLRDEASRHGIMIAGVRVHELVLRPGALFSLGDFLPMFAASARTEVVRSSLVPFLGWGAAYQYAVDVLTLATCARTHVVLRSDLASEARQIAHLVHQLGPGAAQPFVEVAGPVDGSVLRRTEDGTLVVPLTKAALAPMLLDEVASGTRGIRTIAIAPSNIDAASVLGEAWYKAAAHVQVSPLAERPDDAARLVPLLEQEHRERFGGVGIEPKWLPTLGRLRWATRDHLSAAVRYLIALRACGSATKAAQALGLSRSAMYRWLFVLEHGPEGEAVTPPATA